MGGGGGVHQFGQRGKAFAIGPFEQRAGLAEQVLLRVAGNPLGSAIPGDEAPLSVDGEDPSQQRIDNMLKSAGCWRKSKFISLIASTECGPTLRVGCTSAFSLSLQACLSPMIPKRQAGS
ncbi:MAG: hypothetical protein R3C56_11665 [Pirellulaceae bacterium]